VASLVNALGEDGARELVGIYLEDFPVRVADLASGDPVLSERAAHSLKSSSQQMGFPALARKLAELEEKVGRNRMAVTTADVDSVKAEYARCEVSLRAFMAG
jgi:HPt (histidine-containing phosphotransfer) domain-containing protein